MQIQFQISLQIFWYILITYTTQTLNKHIFSGMSLYISTKIFFLDINIMNNKIIKLLTSQNPPQNHFGTLLGLTLQEAASGMHPKGQGGGADSAHPYKNQFRGLFDPIFGHNFDWGTKITQEKIFEIGFQPQKCRF